MPYPGRDGSSIAILSMLRSLLKVGHEVHVFSLNTSKHFVAPETIPSFWKDNIHWEIAPIDNSVEPLGALLNLFSSKSYMVSRFSNSDTKKQLLNVLRSNSFDIVQLEGIFMSDYIPMIRQESNAKLILRAHNVETVIWNRLIQHENSAVKRKYLKLQVKRLDKLEQRVFNSVDGIIPITEEDESLIAQRTSKPTLVAPCGIEDIEPSESQHSKLDFFQLAAMDWLPNIQGVEWFLEEVWPKIRTKVPEATVYLAGRGMPLHLIQQHNPNYGINITGEVDDAREFYRTHGIQIVPLLSGSGMRIKLVEGLSQGKAIISTAIGCEGIGARDGEEMMIASNAVEFADKAISLYTNTELRHEIQKKARHLARIRFDEEKIGNQITQWFSELTAQ